MKDIRERISSSINLYLSKANVHRDPSGILVEYIQNKFIKINDEFYIIKNGVKDVQVSDEDMEWTVETFTQRLYKRRSDGYNKNNTITCKVVDLNEYREMRGRE